MELALSLGDTSKPFKFLDKTPKRARDLGFCMGRGTPSSASPGRRSLMADGHCSSGRDSSEMDPPPLRLDLLPFSPVGPRPSAAPQIRFPWLSHNLLTESGPEDRSGRGFDVNRPSSGEDGGSLSSPNSGGSSFQMEFGLRRSGSKRDLELAEAERAGSRASDDDENGSTRKKLRLSKEQSAFLEESFKEHNTLHPKQKLALAKQLNLRPRQVEVWFQNRRARTKLKQTEVDCEYLKRCCETLTEENRRLQKELYELRALKTSLPLYMHLPATTLTMCPSCERVAPTTPAAAVASTPNLFPFSQSHRPASS